jgi:hypothetical protein
VDFGTDGCSIGVRKEKGLPLRLACSCRKFRTLTHGFLLAIIHQHGARITVTILRLRSEVLQARRGIELVYGFCVMHLEGLYFRGREVLLAPQKTDDNKNEHDNDQNMHGG